MTSRSFSFAGFSNRDRDRENRAVRANKKPRPTTARSYFLHPKPPSKPKSESVSRPSSCSLYQFDPRVVYAYDMPCMAPVPAKGMRGSTPITYPWIQPARKKRRKTPRPRPPASARPYSAARGSRSAIQRLRMDRKGIRSAPVSRPTTARHPHKPKLHLEFLWDLYKKPESDKEPKMSEVGEPVKSVPHLALRQLSAGETLSRSASTNVRFETGEQAIEFFARYASTTAIKFVYCNRVPVSPREFRPYDLVVVPRKIINKEFFTISGSGIVHICPGEPSDFISLADWMHDSSLFNVIRLITFFKDFWFVKVFRVWRETVRHGVFVKQRKILSRKLILMNRTFQRRLFRISEILYGLQQNQLLDYRYKETISLSISQFEMQQTQVRLDTIRVFDSTVETLQTYLSDIIRDVQRSVKVSGITLGLHPLDQLRQPSIVTPACSRSFSAWRSIRNR
eukprot:36934_1